MLVTSIAAGSAQHAVSHSPAVAILLVVAALLLGVVVVVVPLVVFRLAAGGGRRRGVPAARRAPIRSARLQPFILEPVALEQPVVALPSVVTVAPEPALESSEPAPTEVVSDRHRDLYHDEYARQLDRVETLRQAIRTRLAVGVSSQPESAAMEASDA